MHVLTKNKDMVLRIDLVDTENRSYFAKYKFATFVFLKNRKFNVSGFSRKKVSQRCFCGFMYLKRQGCTFKFP